jgi:hypothetical protein
MVFNKKNYISIEPLGKERSFSFETWVRLSKLPETGEPMKIFQSGKSVTLSVISHGRVSFSVKNNLPEAVVFDTKAALLKPLVW